MALFNSLPLILAALSSTYKTSSKGAEITNMRVKGEAKWKGAVLHPKKSRPLKAFIARQLFEGSIELLMDSGIFYLSSGLMILTGTF